MNEMEMLGERIHKVPKGECAYCDRERDRQSDFHPPHEPMHFCRSGRRPHCSCDSCF